MTNVYFNLNQMQHPCRRTMVGWTGTPSENREMTEPRECGLTHDHHGTISYAQPIHTPTQPWRESGARVAKYVAMIFAVLVMSIANIGTAWGASVAEGTYNFVDQSIGAAKKFYKIDNGIYQYRLNAYTKNSSLGIQLPASGDGTGFVFHLESTQKVYIGICKKKVKTEVVNNLYIKAITEANFSDIEAGTSNSTTVTLSLAGSATLSQNYTFAGIGSQKTEGATVYMGELPAGYYYVYGNSTGGNGNLYSISFGTQTLFLVPNDKTSDNAKFAIYYWMGASGYERQGWSDYMTVSPCNSSTYRADIPKGYTKVIFVRLNPSGGRNWDSKWNQTGNLTFDGTKDLFTWANGDWSEVTTTWSASTKYTISFAANGGSGSMSNVSGIACGRSVAIAANAYEKSGFTFTGWKANVDVKVGGETKTAGTLLADGVTIQDITSNITLTAQWEADAPACSAPTSPSISGTTSYTAGDNISLTASATGTSGTTTYTWYKGATWDAASATTPVQAESTSGATFAKATCVVGDAGTYWCNISNGTGCEAQVSKTITVAAGGCAASEPGDISKGEASGGTGTITLTADGSPVSGDAWYWQASASGTSKSESGTTKNVSSAGTYYIRSYNSAGDCWSDAKSVTVDAADLLTPISLSLTYDNSILVLTTITSATPTLTGNTGSGTVSYTSGTTATATVNSLTGVVTAVAAGTTTITVNVAAKGNYAAGSTTATIKVVPAPLGIVDQKLATGAVAWDASTIVTSDYTNITGLSAFAAQGELSIDGGNGTTSGGTALTAKVEASGGTSKADSKYMEFHFTVAAGKRLHVTAINAVVRSVSNDRVYYATLTGTTGSITKTTTVTEATSAGANIFEGQSYDEYFTGTVSFKLWAYSTSTQTKNLWYRIGSNIYITGTIEDDCTTPAAPTAFSAGSITTTGATFTITDAADAESYDIYYSTSSTAPTASTEATTTSTSKTKAVTGLTASTTYYAWVRSVCDASHKSEWVALNPAGDTHTFTTSCVAPTTVNVTATVNEVSGYWFYPGDAVVLTATPTGSPVGSPVTYQWANGGVDIVGATSSTYSVASATTADAGKYTCTISYGECSTTSAEFSLKCMQFYLKNSSGEDISNHALEKVDDTHATLNLSLTGGTTYKFRVTDGCGDWYGNTGEMTSSNCTNWTMGDDADCSVTTSSKTATYTFNFDFSAGLLGSEMKVSVVYPSGDQASGKVIYWDNSVLNWSAGNQWYRIGKGSHNNKTQMTLVPGTTNLYKVTTTEYSGFEYWHIANNQGEGTGNIFWTKDSDPTTDEAITSAMRFEGSPVTADAVTVTPTTTHETGGSSDNNNCEFYEYGITTGIKTNRVTISDYSNGTITVNYTNTSNEAATLTSGYADLAHTVQLTSITAVADAGYDAGAITINGGAYSANYVVTGATTIAASFTPHVYAITYKDQGGVDFSGEHGDGHPTTHTYASATELVAPTKDGYDFDGWFTNSTCTGDPVTSLGATDFTADITLYAKWTFIPVLTAMSADVLYQAADMANITFTGSDQYWAGLSTNTFFKTYGNGTSNSAKGKTISSTNITDDIGEKSFTSEVYIEGSDVTSGTSDPTYGAIEFITPSSAGILYVYTTDGSGSNLKLRKKGSSTFTPLNGSSKYNAVVVDASSNYYIHGNSSKRGLYGILYVSTYAVDDTGCSNVTKVTGEATAIKGKTYTATFTANSGYRLPSDATVKIGGVTQTKGTDYTWTISDGTATLTIPAAKVTDAIVIDVDGEQVYQLTVVVNTEGYGTVSPTSVLVPATGLETSSSSNTFTVNGTTVIATPTASTVEYTYAFDSWSGLPATVTASATVTANFTRTAVNYTLTWDANGGDELTGDYTSGTVAYGTTIVAPNDPTRDGYDFAGWDVNPAATMPAANTTYTAQWAQKFTVTYDAVGGTCVTASAQGSSENPITLPTPTKEDYKFQGWYVAGVKIGDAGAEYTPTADVTAYARWKAECDGGEEITWDFTDRSGQDFEANSSYSFSANDGVTEMRYSAGSSDKIVAKKDDKDGHLYENGTTGSGTVYDIDSETNVGKTRLIRLYVTGSGKLTINCNGERNGVYKVLNGSASGSTLIEALSANTQSSVINVTTSPIWIETTTKGYITTILWSPQSCYYITYDGHGADGGYTGDEEAYAANSDPVVKTNGFTKDGYAFVGWNTAADGSGTAYAEGATITDISADVTLYAQWAVITTFNGNVSGHETEWNNTANWSGGALPTINNAVVIENKNIIVNVGDAQAATVILSGTSTLTVQANKALVVDGKITKNGTAPTASDLLLESTSDGNATLIFDNSNSAAATVQMYSKATAEGGWTWQYIAAPAAVSALDNYYGGYLYKWVESSWAAVGRDATMELFAGYCVSYPTAGHTFAIAGALAPTTSKIVSVEAGKSMVIGNSWTAPIQISQMTAEDFTNVDQTVYLYNTGKDESGTAGTDDKDRYAAGTYVPVPIAETATVGVTKVSSLQGFFVKNNSGSAGTLSLSYSKHVRPAVGKSVVNGAMHAPKRVADETDRPAVLKMKVSGSQYDDRLILLEREDFTTGYDAGHDGEKIGDVATSPRITTTREDGTADAVAALPDLEGTLINFRAASTDDQYTLYFDYETEDAEPLYLLDLTNNAYTRVETGGSYTFFTTDKADHKRFALTRYRAPQITTGVEDAQGDSGQNKAVKFIENDKLYILRNGMLYDGTGKRAK